MEMERSAIPPYSSLKRLARAIWTDIVEDNLTGLAGQISYYFSLALFPFLLFLAALAGSLPFTNLWGKILKWVTIYLPDASQDFVLDTVTSLTRGHKRFLSVGVLGTAWAASTGIMNLMRALNIAYEVKETRSYFHRVAFAVMIVFVLAFFFVASFALLSTGDWLDEWLAARITLSTLLLGFWHIARWIVSLFLFGVGVWLVNYSLPNAKRPWRCIAPGTLFTALAWIGATQSFNFYVRHVASYDKTYGALGAFVILMLWIYIMSLITLIGADVNSHVWKINGEAAQPLIGRQPGTSERVA